MKNTDIKILLVDDLGTVIQFLSYEGIIVATDGPAIGMTSVDIGVSEPGAIGESLQLVGSGSDYNDFNWVGPTTASPGTLNSNQTLSVAKNQIEGFSLYPNPISNGKLFIKSSRKLNQQVEIYSMIGKQVYSENVETNEIIDVSNLTTGIYMIKVEEAGKIATRKLVIE